MDSHFHCIMHHGGEFVEFTKLGYKGLKETWDVDLDFWTYFEFFSGLKVIMVGKCLQQLEGTQLAKCCPLHLLLWKVKLRIDGVGSYKC